MSYVHSCKQSALAKMDSSAPASPLNRQERTALDLKDVAGFTDEIPITDIDLYLCLLVYATKSLYSTCDALFDKFETAIQPKGHLTRKEWANLCIRCDIEVPKDIEQKCWEVLAWRKDGHNEALMVDFLAVWRVHDLEAKDNSISRIARVLKLKYYEMEISDMTSRLHNHVASGESELGYDRTSNSTRKLWAPPLHEGERRVTSQRTKSAPSTETPSFNAGTMTPRGTHYDQEEIKVSLNNDEYMSARASQQAGDDSDCDDSGVSLNSSDLSEDSLSSGSSLDKLVIAEDVSEPGEYDAHEYGAHDPHSRGRGKNTGITSDDALHQLMLTFHSKKEKIDVSKQDNAMIKAQVKKKKTATGQMRKQVKDPRFKTDVVPVRKCIRDVYRSRPPDAFSKLVNFLLRGLRYMKHAPATVPSYWHESDPIFRTTVGHDAFSVKLLEVMGFYKISSYWIWPALHVKPTTVNGEKMVVWGDQEIPDTWIGRHPDRLDDIILLFKACQKTVNTTTRTFTGHF